MVIRLIRRTSVQTSQEIAIVPFESVQNGQYQALVPVGGAGEGLLRRNRGVSRKKHKETAYYV